MAAAGLVARIELIGSAVEDIAVARAAADAMDETMRKATATYIGGDLRMSNFRGAPVEFTKTIAVGRAELRLGGGTYALADKGRRRARRRIYPRSGRALLSPAGPRRWVKGSKTAGFKITARHGQKALDAGIEAAARAVHVAVRRAA